MNRATLTLLGFALLASMAHADVFDRYTNPILAKAPGATGVMEVQRLTPALIAEHGRLLPDSGGVLLMVKTNNGLNAKCVLQLARQRKGADSVPIALLDRVVTYKAGGERVVQAATQNIHLYPGFAYNLELGQVVPADVGADLRFVGEADSGYIEPVGKAKLYLITKPLPGTETNKAGKFAAGEVFEPQHFTGVYKLHDDGRRAATLSLKVDAEGQVIGDYVSEKTGQRYEVTGKAGGPKHFLQFRVKFPQSEQHFQGHIFTRDAKVICGVTRLQEHEFGWYAVRVEGE